MVGLFILGAIFLLRKRVVFGPLGCISLTVCQACFRRAPALSEQDL
jgi:hypothetical protein